MAWFSRRKRPAKRPDAPRLRSRDEVATTKVDLVDFAPVPEEYLGRAAYVQLTLFENLSRAVSTAPTTEAKAVLTRVAELSLDKHRGLAAEIERTGSTAGAAMEPYTAPADEFERQVRGGDWYETVLTCYLTGGFLDDFFAKLAEGLPGDQARRIADLLNGESGAEAVVELLQAAIEDNPRLASRLAMWGRRLVGDTMLLARSALDLHGGHNDDEARIEPVFTELIAQHTRRMDALGLSA